MGAFLRKFLNAAAALHCTDESEVQSAKSLGIHAPAFVVPNGIDTIKFQALPARGQMKQRLGIPAESLVLLFSGRIVRIKRVDIAIEVLAQALNKGIQVRLVVAGPDEEGLVNELREQARRLGCDRHVFFTGLLKGEALLSAYADADLFIMPSEIQENFGMSALEAMAAGLPILVSEGIPVGRYAVRAGAGKALPSTSDAFTQAVVELLQDPQELKQMGERGRILAREKFDTLVVVKEMLAQYTSIVETGAPL
jgi:glycosyltransferase involved in cell wall biosynthesis